jgi:ferredoxin
MARVQIDSARCRGHQMCIMGSPDIFVESDDIDGRAQVLQSEQPEERLAELLDAAASCPERAVLVARG